MPVQSKMEVPRSWSGKMEHVIGSDVMQGRRGIDIIDRGKFLGQGWYGCCGCTNRGAGRSVRGMRIQSPIKRASTVSYTAA